MPNLKRTLAVFLGLCLASAPFAFSQDDDGAENAARHKRQHRNLIVFVADGLRHDSVNPTDAPTMQALRAFGVHFVNSHSLFPTFTMPNGSAIASGHLLGDTGIYGNTLYTGYPIFETGNFGQLPGTVTPFIENDLILSDLDAHFGGNLIDEETLLALARQNGYNTASIGKVGPAAMQDVSQVSAVNGQIPTPQTVIIDDATGSASGVPLRADIVAALTSAGLPTVAPNRSNGCAATAQCNNGFSGNNTTPGTTSPNLVQQQFFVDALTKAVLPSFLKNGKPFAVTYWSRDPDGTQHNQGDSLNSLTPGINGPTSRAAVHNADNNLAQILAFLAANPDVAANTDIFITSDHGFATISRHEVDAKGTPTRSYSTQFIYKDITGRQEVNTGFLPNGFVAIDLAHYLNLPLFDPDTIITKGTQRGYKPVDPTVGQNSALIAQRPAAGDGLIGASGNIVSPSDAKVIVAANGGSDLIYIPDHDSNRLRSVVRFLLQQDYVGALFVDDSFGRVPGTLPLSSIGLVGSALTPRPSIAISFKTFYLQPGNLLSAVQVADTGLQEGQGMHGTIARDNTFNNMIAFGPDFKFGYTDRAPVSNADIAVTLAHVLGLRLESQGRLQGRVVREALDDGPNSVPFERIATTSRESSSGRSTLLISERVGEHEYFDEACFIGENTTTFACH